jgi:acyl-coenzyme A thioesterase 13
VTIKSLPAGYENLYRESPFVKLLGPIYQNRGDGKIKVALRAEEKHCNSRGDVHGGVLSSLADFAMGYTLAFEHNVNAVTASLTIDYIGRVSRGDWIEIHTEVTKLGKRLAFVQASLRVEGALVTRANGVFNVLAKPLSGVAAHPPSAD